MEIRVTGEQIVSILANRDADFEDFQRTIPETVEFLRLTGEMETDVAIEQEGRRILGD